MLGREKEEWEGKRIVCSVTIFITLSGIGPVRPYIIINNKPLAQVEKF